MTNVEEILRSKVRKGSKERMLIERAMYSASQVERAISVWSLLSQMIGHPAYSIM